MENRPTKVGFALVVLALAVSAATCTDPPPEFFAIDDTFADDDYLPTEPHHVLGAYRCRVTVRTPANPDMSCTPTNGATNDGASPIIVGGQGVYVLMENADPDPPIGDALTVPDVTVTNLMSRPIGTPDGIENTGIHVFFQAGPTNGVEVINATGDSTFLAANQQYFLYDEILATNETSQQQDWEFDLNGATSFEFGVLIAADQPPPPEPQILTLWSGTGIRDAGIALGPGLSNTNFGFIDYIITNNAFVARFAGLLWFDLSTVPDDVEILDAELAVYHEINTCGNDTEANPPAGPCQYDVHPVTGAWTEDGVTWINGSGLKGETAVATLVIDDGANGTFREWDVTDLVANWYDGSEDNHGFWIEMNPAGTPNLYFVSHEHGESDFRPTLTITYQNIE